MRYTLLFDGDAGRRHMAEFESDCIDDAISESQQFIMEYCDIIGYKIHYIRMWTEEDETRFDFGSWSEFFILKQE